MKNDTLILGIIFFGVMGLASGFVTSAIMAQKPPHQVEITTQQMGVLNYSEHILPDSTKKSICKKCHLSGKIYIPQANTIKQHDNGGVYCLKCHYISHENHPVNENVTCIQCHGDSQPGIPSPEDQKIVCNNCHMFPDALMPSYGNLMLIHEPRGISCISCHIDCRKCHEKDKPGKKWENRINHLNLFLNNSW